jgi:hypothetical protein
MAWQKKRERIGKVSSEMSGNAFKFEGWGGGGVVIESVVQQGKKVCWIDRCSPGGWGL